MLIYVITPYKSSCDCNLLHSDNATFQSHVKNSQKPTTAKYAYFVLCCDILCIMLLYFCNSVRKYISFLEGKIKIYKAMFKHCRHKRELCCNQCYFKEQGQKRERQKQLTLFWLVLRWEHLRAPTGRLNFLTSPQTWLAILHLMISRLLMKPQVAHLVQLTWNSTLAAVSTSPISTFATLGCQLTFLC